MMLLAIIERNRYLGKETYITFTDVEKCFDNLWLEDTVVDIWKDGMNVKDAMMIKKMNEYARACVITPFGETEEIELFNTVKQGGVSGMMLCCSSLGKINKMGRRIVTKHGPELEINAQVYVDDMESAGSLRTANNTIFNCRRMEEKKHITINTDQGKSAVMYIKGRKEKNERTLHEEVKRGRIKKVDKYVFLGTGISEKGYNLNSNLNLFFFFYC